MPWGRYPGRCRAAAREELARDAADAAAGAGGGQGRAEPQQEGLPPAAGDGPAEEPQPLDRPRNLPGQLVDLPQEYRRR